MKKIILLVSFLYFSACVAQTINLEPASPAPQFQDADVGSIAFGDIDNDGDNDLIATGKGGPIKSTLYKNDGTGNFTEVMGTPFVNLFSGTVKFADVDNDDDLDIMMTGSDSRPIKHANLYLNDGMGNFTLATGTPFQPYTGGDFEFADVDKDNDLDLLMTGYLPQVGNDPQAGFVKLYRNNGLGIFTEVMGTPFEAVKGSSIGFIDIDNDNDPDVIIAGENDQDVLVTKLYSNDSTGNFTLVANTPFTNTYQGDIAIADTDNDGDQDVLISGNSNNGTVSNLYTNDGTGSFSLLAGTPFPGSSIGATNFADFDNDGDPDVLIVGNGAAIIANIYENLGSNTFVLADSLPGAYLASTAIGDMDGDKDLDLLIGGTSFTAPVRSTKTYINETPIQTDIDKEESLENVRMYPNPSNGIIHIELKQSAECTVSIYNITGERIYSNKHVSGLKSQIQLNQSPGLYVVVIKTDHVTTRHKLILK